MFAIGPQTMTSLSRVQQQVGALGAACAGQGRLVGTLRAAELIAARARTNIGRSPNSRPGHVHLAETVGVRQYQHDATTTRVGIGTDDVRGLWLETGTSPHEITPRNKQALSWEGAGHPVARVQHPGARARPWLYPAAQEEAATAAQAFGQAVVEAAKAGSA